MSFAGMEDGKAVLDKILREHNKLHLLTLIPEDLKTLMVRTNVWDTVLFTLVRKAKDILGNMMKLKYCNLVNFIKDQKYVWEVLICVSFSSADA